MTDVKLLLLHSNTWNNLSVCQKMTLGSFQNVINKMSSQSMYV